MPRRYCGSCRGDLHADDGHSECVSCLGKAHADAALAGSDCSHCESISLASLRTRIAFFSESDPAPRALPFSSSQGPVRKKQRGRGFQRLVESELTPAQIPRASFSPHRELSPVLFIQPDQRPSASVSDLVSFGGSDDELADDSMSLVASDAEELWGSVTDPAPSGLPAPSAAKAGMDAELFRVLSKAVEELGLEWSPPEEPSRSRLDEWFLPGRRQAPQQRPSPFFPEVHDELTRSWRSPYSARLRTSASSALTTVDGAEEKGYERMPQLDESVAAHLCPPTAIGWKAKASHPSKPCRTTSALAGRSYASAGQAASALHSMAVLQVYQAKLLSAIDESEPDPATLRELRSATDLALRATKTTAQAIGRSMASLVVLERHLWLTLTEIKDADRVSFLDAPISPSGLFGPAVKGFAERFTEAQKASQAMRHFLPKRSSPAAAQSRPRTAPTQQSAKPAPAVYAPQPARTQQPRGRSRSARRHPPPTRQGPRLKIALDPVRPASSWSAGQEEERVESRHGRTAHQKASHGKPLGTPFFSGCRGSCVCCYRVRTSDHATVRCDSGKNKTQTFSKREQFSSSVPHECPASVQPATRVYPTPCHAGRGLAGHPRSVRVGYGDNKTRLFTPIRSKTPALQRRGLHLGAGRERSRSALRGDDAAGKRSHRNGFSSFERVRLLQPLLPRPQKGWRPPAHPRSQTPESRPHETAVQDDHTEADPLADLHRGLVLFSGPERCILSHPDSPPSQTILEIRLRGSGLPVHGPTLWAVSGPPYFYEVHGRGSFPSETDGNPHSQLPRRAAHLPGRLNQGADMLSRSNVPSEEWMLHPQVVQKIWKTFGKAEVDLFASKDNSHCPTYYSKDRDALAHDWPNLLLYAFPPIALLPQVVRRIREQGHKVLLVAPLWRNQPWLSELTQLLTAAPWPVPLRRDLLSQANGTIWHPRPELWALYIWPLNGSLLASQSECWTPFLRLEPRLRDASMPLSGLFSPLGASTVVKTPLPLS